jgi:hypothetical protein
MKQTAYFVLAISLVVGACKPDYAQQANTQTVANGRDTAVTFSVAESPTLPLGWSAETGNWTAALDNSNAALKMESNTGSDFNIAVLTSERYQNVEIEARVKALGGEEDQGGGLVWRYVNVKNYYIIRANPLENNIRLYKVVNGSRKQMQSESASIKTGEWFTIKIKTQGDKIECYLNEEKVFSDTDNTFADAGRIGFWSKADAASLFDDLKIKVLK